jgi:pyridoxamine 5'-phosphate oxidase family protein
MRFLVPLVAIVVALAAAYVVYLATTPLARGRDRRLRARASWQTRHYGANGETVVAVSLTRPGGEILDEHVVARLRDDDPEWSAKFLRAREEAAERAFHLNADRDPPALP